MAINPAAASSVLSSLQDIAQKLTTLAGPAPVQNTVTAAPAAAFTPATLPPMNLLGGQSPDMAQSMSALMQVLQSVVQLISSFTGQAAQTGAIGGLPAGNGAAPMQNQMQGMPKAPAQTFGPAAQNQVQAAPAGFGAPAQNFGPAQNQMQAAPGGFAQGQGMGAPMGQNNMAGPGVVDNRMGGQGAPAGFQGQNQMGAPMNFNKHIPTAGELGLAKKTHGQWGDAQRMLGNARPTVSPGMQGGPGKLALTADEVAAIQSATSPEQAKQIVKQAMQRQGGGMGGGMNNAALEAAGAGGKAGKGGKKGKKGKKEEMGAQGTINGLLGSKLKGGQNKTAASNALFDQMASDVAQAVRNGTSGGPSMGMNSATPYGSDSGTPYGQSGTPFSDTPFSPGLSSGPQTVDLAPYNPIANRIAEMGSPLIFDLTGQGHMIREAEMVPVELDGDGRLEIVTDLEESTGVLVFDPKLAGDEHRTYALGAEMFGSGTDLTAYGIKATTDDGTFENGFDALRAVAEKFGLVHGAKQYLDAKDLAFLESAIGLKMRVGGLFGDDVRVHDAGITHIALGASGMTQSLEHAQSDSFGNKYMRQAGAMFTIRGERREYVDIFFRIQARVAMDQPIAAQLRAAA